MQECYGQPFPKIKFGTMRMSIQHDEIQNKIQSEIPSFAMSKIAKNHFRFLVMQNLSSDFDQPIDWPMVGFTRPNLGPLPTIPRFEACHQ